MTELLEQKLKQLPHGPGVYFYKNAKGQIIYVGKAAVLKNRVRQYFQAGRPLDVKTTVLIAEIADIDWIQTASEIDALFLEAEHIRRYQPKFNILLRDDKSYVFVRINLKDAHPTVSITRRPLDDKAEYFGPYDGAYAIKTALKYLRRAFPYSTHDKQIPKRACLLYHIGLCPGLEENKTSLSAYKSNLKKLILYLRGARVALINTIEKEMKIHAKNSEFELAAKARDQLRALKRLQQTAIFSDREFLDMSRDHALAELTELLEKHNLWTPQILHLDGVQGSGAKRKGAVQGSTVTAHRKPLTQQSAKRASRVAGSASKQASPVRGLRRIEGFDISHHSGTDTTASMVVFSYGLPDKASYRKFKMRSPGNDDFAHMREVLSRRFNNKNRIAWGMPDLILIDGGKGQVSAALEALESLDLSIPLIGLAKRFETVILPQKLDEGRKLEEVSLPPSSHLLKLLQRIRDESHRFALSYHSVLKTKRQIAGALDNIPTIGPATRKKLLKTFGSVRGLNQVRQIELEKAVGPRKATILRQYLHSSRKNYDS